MGPNLCTGPGDDWLYLFVGRGLISPLVDYDEWLPLGRGDPLRNDPTYDYMPPTLDRVNYWLEPESRTPDLPPTSQVLLLGFPSSSKKSPGKQEVSINI